MATTVQPLTGTYELDPHHSTVQFAVRHQQVSTFRASFADVDVSTQRRRRDDHAQGQARVESVTIVEPPEFREHVVRGADFFDADAYPLIGFRSTRVELGDDGAATVTGELTIRGTTRDDHRKAGRTSQRGKIPSASTAPASSCGRVVDRRSWDLNWQLPLPDGSDALGWDVEITAQLELIRKD